MVGRDWRAVGDVDGIVGALQLRIRQCRSVCCGQRSPSGWARGKNNIGHVY